MANASEEEFCGTVSGTWPRFVGALEVYASRGLRLSSLDAAAFERLLDGGGSTGDESLVTTARSLLAEVRGHAGRTAVQ